MTDGVIGRWCGYAPQGEPPHNLNFSLLSCAVCWSNYKKWSSRVVVISWPPKYKTKSLMCKIQINSVLHCLQNLMMERLGKLSLDFFMKKHKISCHFFVSVAEDWSLIQYRKNEFFEGYDIELAKWICCAISIKGSLIEMMWGDRNQAWHFSFLSSFFMDRKGIFFFNKFQKWKTNMTISH